jgi:hypothetical protein
MRDEWKMESPDRGRMRKAKKEENMAFGLLQKGYVELDCFR